MTEMLLCKARTMCKFAVWSAASLIISMAAYAGSDVIEKTSPDAEQGLFLSRDGQSPFSIVLPQEASVTDRSAADELQYFLAEIAGAKLPIVTDGGEIPGQAILLG